jgi:hypothetical protein
MKYKNTRIWTRMKRNARESYPLERDFFLKEITVVVSFLKV